MTIERNLNTDLLAITETQAQADGWNGNVVQPGSWVSDAFSICKPARRTGYVFSPHKAHPGKITQAQVDTKVQGLDGLPQEAATLRGWLARTDGRYAHFTTPSRTFWVSADRLRVVVDASGFSLGSDKFTLCTSGTSWGPLLLRRRALSAAKPAATIGVLDGTGNLPAQHGAAPTTPGYAFVDWVGDWDVYVDRSTPVGVCIVSPNGPSYTTVDKANSALRNVRKCELTLDGTTWKLTEPKTVQPAAPTPAAPTPPPAPVTTPTGKNPEPPMPAFLPPKASTKHKTEVLAEKVWTDAWTALVKARVCGLHALVTGVPGTGKTTLGQMIGDAVGLPVTHITAEEDMTTHQIIGQWIPGETWKYVEGPALRAFRDGHLLVLNEIDRFPDSVRQVLYGVMDDPSVATLMTPDGPVKRHPDFFVLGTTNSPFEELTLPEALLDRLPVKIELNVPNPSAVRSMTTAALAWMAWDVYTSLPRPHELYRKVSVRQLRALDKLIAAKLPVASALAAIFPEKYVATAMQSALAVAGVK